ncbi:replication initiation protein [Desulfobulbus sp. TB]|nr:replication initiation protein [Desulfobulbus sp. TB]
MQNKNKKQLVVQSNKLLEARYSLTVGEQRLILAMVSMIHSDDADFFDYKISMKDLSGLLSIDTKNIYCEFDKIIERLMSRILHIVKSDGLLLRSHWVSTAEYQQGSVVLSFSPKLKPYLLNLKREFTKFNFSIVTQFKSIYSIRIYQLLKQYKGIGYREFSVDVLKEILGIKKEKYREFKRFRGRVLNQAKKEFDKKDKAGCFQCDLTFILETIREGRKISILKFIIIEQELSQSSVAPPNILKKSEEKAGKPETVKGQLKYYGISDSQATGFLNRIPESDIKDILAYYEDLLQSGKVQNTGGAYLAKLLRDGIKVKSTYDKDKASAEDLRQKKIELERQQAELDRQKDEENYRKKSFELEERFSALPAADQRTLLAEFEGTLKRFLLEIFHKDGIQSVVIKGNFLEFLAKKFDGEAVVS